MNKNRPGFTLPELMLAVGLLAVVLSAVYSVFWAGLKAGSRKTAEIHISARESLDLIGRDIRSACFRPGISEFALTGEEHGRGKKENDSISLCTVMKQNGGGNQPRPVRVEYYTAGHPVTGKTILYRNIEAISGNDEMNIQGEPVAPYINEFDVKYFHDGSWHELWDNKDIMPDRVLLRVGMGADDSEKCEWFETEVALTWTERKL